LIQLNHIFLLLVLIPSVTLTYMDVQIYGGASRFSFFTPKNRIDSKVTSPSSTKEFSGNDYELPYRLILNNDQDTSKTNSGKVLFGRSFLKNHYELHGKKAVVDQEKRTEWISKAVDILKHKNDIDFPQLSMNELIHEDFYQASYRLIEKGIINFNDGSYVKLMSTSAHAISEIGDITLAVDEQGSVYINQGHICGRIIHFNTHQKGLALSAETFLKNFTSDTDDEPWQLYRGSK
jgi:hypothetical protein